MESPENKFKPCPFASEEAIKSWNAQAIPDRTQIRKEVCEEILSGLPDPKDWGKAHNGWPVGWNNYREECIKVVLRVRDKE